MLLCGSAQLGSASGHGPVFGMATPTNAKGAWSADWGVMGRVGALIMARILPDREKGGPWVSWRPESGNQE
jgi:hypothetical protein